MIRPRNLSRRQTLIATAVILLAMVAGLGIILSQQSGLLQPSPPTPTITPGDITVEGTIVCLPHKNTEGPQTLECAFGLHSDAGDYYGLRNLNQDQLIDGTLSVSTKVRVSGKVAAPEENEIYGVIGNIDVESIEVISSSASHLEHTEKYFTIIPVITRGAFA